MNNILCPVSDEKVNEKLVRFTAFLAFVISLIFIVNPHFFLVLFLAFDFYMRGFGVSRISILALTGQGLKDYIPFRSKTIDKAPKIFAARLGFVLSLIAMIFSLLELNVAAQATISILAFFAFLEWAMGFCMGCYIYSWIIIPYFTRK